MKYVSTRGEAPALGFSDVLLAGLARDGGLYVPETWPSFTPEEIADMVGRPYAEVAYRVISPFVGGEISSVDLRRMIDEAYATFRHPAVTPIAQIAPGHFLLELFHGPTLAFKDVAMQLLARLMDYVLAWRNERATIVGATSGDTGGAAVEAFRGRERTDLFILFPNGRVSPVQQRQMTTATDENVSAIAIDGTFDDAQAIVKGMFNHFSFRDRVGLSGINSINWARVMAQTVYYFVAAAALGAPWRAVSFTVPTGNFGDIFAAYAARRMGLPIGRLVIATNVNDILDRTMRRGTYRLRDVVPTASPSMDIQVSSNFERLLFDAYGRDGAAIRRLMGDLKQSGSFTVDAGPLEWIRAHFASGRTGEDETRETIGRVHRDAGILIDPHTAVGVAAAEAFVEPGTPMVTLATAHPAKFPDVVRQSSGVYPALPAWLADLNERAERYDVLPADQFGIERHVERHTRAMRVGL